MPDKNIEKAKKLFIEKGLSYAAIASLLGISSRTVERWSSKGNWKLLREAEELASLAVAPVVAEVLQQPIEASGVRPHLNSITPEAIVELALCISHADLEDAEIRHRNKAEVIASVEKMLKLQHQLSLYKYEIELKRIDIETARAELALKERQLSPPTVREWAEYARDKFKMKARELIEAVKQELG